MAYPAALVAPFPFRANFHAEELKTHVKGNTLRFNATTAADAIAFVPTIAALMSAINTSLTQRIGQHNEGAAHPVGTRLSCKVLIRDSGIGVARYNLRNVAPAIPSASIAWLFTQVGAVPAGCTAMSAAASFPKNGNLVVSADAPIITKP